MIETRRIVLDGLDFTVDIAGPAAPAVLLLHGFPEITSRGVRNSRPWPPPAIAWWRPTSAVIRPAPARRPWMPIAPS